MDQRHSGYVGPVGDDQVGQRSRRSGHWPRSSRSVRGRVSVEMFGILVLLGLGLVPIDRARAQDTPAKAEVPQEAASSEDLSVRYRFTEKYSLNDDPEKPELVSQYQVAMHGTRKMVTEKPQGAPDRSETSPLIIYTERPAKVSKIGEVTDTVRHYDKFRLTSTTPISPPKPQWFEGLTIWYHRRPAQEPEILSLTNDRRLREVEFDQITKQMFLPQLTAVFPPTPARVGDTWHISRESARYLVFDTPDPEGYRLDATLLEVHRAASVTALTAVIGITGQFDVAEKHCAVGARIQFTFEPRETVAAPVGTGTSPIAAGGAAKPVERIVDARGFVSRVLMTQTATASYPIPENDGQLKQTTTFELNLERRRKPTAPTLGGGATDAPLSIPDPAPTANEDNSWLVYQDPQRQFYFRCPQKLRLEPRAADPNIVELVDRHLRGSSLIFQFVPKASNPERERQLRDPDFHRRSLYTLWDEQHWDVVKGAADWLPESDWLPLKRKVYRIEAATKPPEAAANAPRQYRDYYLVLFTTTNQMMVVWAITDEDHLKFREQAEAVIKTFQFGPPDGQPTSPAATQLPAPAPPDGQPTSPAATQPLAPKPPL
jgi:hypothetical protein